MGDLILECTIPDSNRGWSGDCKAFTYSGSSRLNSLASKQASSHVSSDKWQDMNDAGRFGILWV